MWCKFQQNWIQISIYLFCIHLISKWATLNCKISCRNSMRLSSDSQTVKYKPCFVIFAGVGLLWCVWGIGLSIPQVYSFFILFIFCYLYTMNSPCRLDLMVWPDWVVLPSTMSSSLMHPRAGKKGWLKVSDSSIMDERLLLDLKSHIRWDLMGMYWVLWERN